MADPESFVNINKQYYVYVPEYLYYYEDVYYYVDV